MYEVNKLNLIKGKKQNERITQSSLSLFKQKQTYIFSSPENLKPPSPLKYS